MIRRWRPSHYNGIQAVCTAHEMSTADCDELVLLHEMCKAFTHLGHQCVLYVVPYSPSNEGVLPRLVSCLSWHIPLSLCERNRVPRRRTFKQASASCQLDVVRPS